MIRKMTFADLQFVCLLNFTDAPEDDLAIWVDVISLHVEQGFDFPVYHWGLGRALHEQEYSLDFWSSVCHYGLLRGKSYSSVLKTR